MRTPPLVAALLLAGCMTVDTRTSAGYEGARTYSGARADLALIGEAALSLNLPVLVIFGADLPLSLVADTALLPITLGEERIRQEGIGAAKRAEQDGPSPVQTLSGVTPRENARRLFEACASYFARLDARVTDCFAADAEVMTGGLVTTGARYKLELGALLVRLRKSGGFISYRKPSFRRVEERVRVDATLVSSLVERTPVHFFMAEGGDGGWRIVEASGPPWPE